jgi:hypothetical protein
VLNLGEREEAQADIFKHQWQSANK